MTAPLFPRLRLALHKLWAALRRDRFKRERTTVEPGVVLARAQSGFPVTRRKHRAAASRKSAH